MTDHQSTILEFIRRFTSRIPAPLLFEVYCRKPSGVIVSKQFGTTQCEQATDYTLDHNERGFNCYLSVNPSYLVQSVDDKVTRPKIEDIARRSHILLDIEVEGSLRGRLPATDTEKEIAHASSLHVAKTLADYGWNLPTVVDSGNGFQLTYLANLPNSEQVTEKLKVFTQCLNDLIEIPDIVVDPGTINPTCGFRIPGTKNFKEHGTKERPWRYAQLISLSDSQREMTEADLDLIIDRINSEKGKRPEPTKYEPIEESTVEPILDANVEGMRLLKTRTRSDVQKAEQYYQAAVRNQCTLMATTDSLRNNTLVSRASSIAHCWSSFRHLLDQRFLRQGLDTIVEAGVASGLKRRECVIAANSAMRYGLKSNRPPNPILDPEKPKRGRPRKDSEKAPGDRSKPLLQSIVSDYLDLNITDGVSRLRLFGAVWYTWMDGLWAPVPDKDFYSPFSVYFEATMLEHHQKLANSSDFSLAKQMFLAMAKSKGIYSEMFDTPLNRIYFKSKWYDTETRKFNDYTPAILNPYRLNCDVHKEYEQPIMFERFMHESLSPNHFNDQYRFILEFIGYCLTNYTNEQKLMYLIGEPGTGKSTFLALLQNILGSSLVATPTMRHLTQDFSEQILIGKRLICVTDTRTSQHMDVQSVIESLLSIVGDDIRTVRRKYKEDWVGKLNCIFVLAMNDFPVLPDHSGALDRRRLIIRFAQVR